MGSIKVEDLAVSASKNTDAFEQLVKENETFILKVAGRLTRRYITKSHDEWSIALLAFSDAVKDYSPEKGGFLPFAELVIKRRLIDYIRKQAKSKSEFYVEPNVFETDPAEEPQDLNLRMEIAEKVSYQKDDSAKFEIEALSESLKKYGFGFFDLVSCSPKTEKTKKSCAKAVKFILKSPVMVSDIKYTGQLPAKVIIKDTGLPRKILERHRKYIIAAVEILTGDYPYLADYIKFIGEESVE